MIAQGSEEGNLLEMYDTDLYAIWNREGLETITVDYVRRIPIDVFEKWYQNQLDRDIGYVMDGHDDIIVGSISEGNPDIEWEFLEEKVWKGLPEKAELTQALREKIKTEREGGFKIYIKGDKVEKVKYSRRMVFGPFLSLGIAAAWLVGSFIMNWYMSLF